MGGRGNAPPHSVMSKMRCCGSKNLSTVHPVDGQLAMGVPRVDVSIVLALEVEVRREGTEGRGKNHILTALQSRSQSGYEYVAGARKEEVKDNKGPTLTKLQLPPTL